MEVITKDSQWMDFALFKHILSAYYLSLFTVESQSFEKSGISGPILKSIRHYSEASWNSRTKEVGEDLTLPTSYVVAYEII